MFIFAPTVGVQSVLSLVYELDAAQDAQFSEMILAEALMENENDWLAGRTECNDCGGRYFDMDAHIIDCDIYYI